MRMCACVLQIMMCANVYMHRNNTADANERKLIIFGRQRKKAISTCDFNMKTHVHFVFVLVECAIRSEPQKNRQFD